MVFSWIMNHSNLIFCRTQDLKEKRVHVPEVDRTPLEPPPVVVALIGPAKVGKSLLMKCLIKNFTRQKLTDIRGPVTVVSGLFTFSSLTQIVKT
jgi:ribosome biogenesis protein BMS1